MSETIIGKAIMGGWYVEELIGAGSFGKVYKASKETGDQKFYSAIKHIVIPTESQYKDVLISMGNDIISTDEYFESMVSELIAEITTMYQLAGNSNIVAYYDHNVVEHKSPIKFEIYIRMEYLTPLDGFNKTNNLSVNDIINLGIDISRALDLCHAKSIIHRDVKEANVFVNSDGHYKLGDFGIAKALNETSKAASMKGTPVFMAPEAYLGQKYDKSVDVYSLGILLYKLLNHNRLPFMPPYPEKISYKDTENALSRRMSGEQMPFPANAPKALAEVVLMACASKPEKRYATANQLQIALQQVLKIIPTQNKTTDNETKFEKKPDDVKNNDATVGSNLGPKNNIKSKTNEETVASFIADPKPKPKNVQKPQPVKNNINQQKVIPSENTYNNFPIANNSPTIAIVMVACVAIVCATVFSLVNVMQNRSTNNEQTPIPTAIITPSPATPKPTVTPVKDDKKIDITGINNIINRDEKNATFSVAIKNLTTGEETLTSNSNSKMAASALINIPVFFTIADGITNGKLTLSDQIMFNYTIEGRGELKQENNGEYFSIEDLLIYMLKYSDNNATNSLLEYLTISKVNATSNRYGFNSIKIERPFLNDPGTFENYVSSHDINRMVEMLYSDKFDIGRSFMNKNMKIFDKTARLGIGKNIPVSNTFLNHNAVTTNKYNEVALISTSKYEYVITVLSDNGEQNSSANTVADISKYVYDCLTNGE